MMSIRKRKPSEGVASDTGKKARSPRVSWTPALLRSLFVQVLEYTQKHGHPKSAAHGKKPTKRVKETSGDEMWKDIALSVDPTGGITGDQCNRKYSNVKTTQLPAAVKKVYDQLVANLPNIAYTYASRILPEADEKTKKSRADLETATWQSALKFDDTDGADISIPQELIDMNLTELTDAIDKLLHEATVDGVPCDEIQKTIEIINRTHANHTASRGMLQSDDDENGAAGQTEANTSASSPSSSSSSTSTSTSTSSHPSARAAAAEMQYAKKRKEAEAIKKRESAAIEKMGDALERLSRAQTSSDIKQSYATPTEWYDEWELTPEQREHSALASIASSRHLSRLTTQRLVDAGVDQQQAAAMMHSLVPFFGPRQ